MLKNKSKTRLSDRRKNILSGVVKEYIKKAQPVSSEHLLKRYNLDVSPATIRGDMMFLEDEGFLEQPHMSAGRIPTDLGYRFYIDELMGEPFLNKAMEKFFSDIRTHMKMVEEDFNKLRSVADYLAQASGNMGVVSFVDRDLTYQNGLCNLLSQPEFSSVENMKKFAKILDNMDVSIADFFEDDDTRVCIGKENEITFPDLGFICTNINRKSGEKFFVGIIGPKRMDYERNIALINQLKELLS
ncbi:MAG: Transcriptional regulator of heat shock protein [Parcubacteria group bacterium GW2011_GWA2_39_18]|nr:MAG: Transcriptional regulator of heat shock protein [Parcubacteria group bacterium GW2011_GWA2_39_18]